MSVTTTTPRVQTGFLGEGRHIFVCKKFPFEVLRSTNFPIPNENLIDENFVHKLNLTQTNITCENYRLGSETVRLVGKISTTIQTVSEGVVIGSMQLKATVVRDLKLLFGTEALPGSQLSQKLAKYETNRNLHELCSMKTKAKKKNVKTEPTKMMKSEDNAKHVDQTKKSANLDQHSKESYFRSLVSKLNDLRTEISESLPSFGSSPEGKPNQEDPHHNIATDNPNTSTVSDDAHDDSLLTCDIPPQPELCEDSDEEGIDSDEEGTENAQPETCVTPRQAPRPVLEQGYNGVWHYPGERTPPLLESPSFSSWKATLDQEYGRQKSPKSSFSTPQSSKSQHWYKDDKQQLYMKYLLKEDPKGVRNVFNMKRLAHVDLPHGPVWCRELCQDLHPQFRPEQCGYTGKDLPSNFQACSYSCPGAWCSCVASYAGRGYWS